VSTRVAGSESLPAEEGGREGKEGKGEEVEDLRKSHENFIIS
jgi:hypothetical protein